MLGESVDPKKANAQLISDLTQRLEDQNPSGNETPLVVSICGESGSGKSVISKAMELALKQKGYSTFVLHMDNYFQLPPREISQKREESLLSVGPQEVNLERLDRQIKSIAQGEPSITLPTINFKDNKMAEITVSLPPDLQYLLVEGTYVSLLKNTQLKVFIRRNYMDTHIHRSARMREPQTELIEKVLNIEHNIVSQFVCSADIVINKSFLID